MLWYANEKIRSSAPQTHAVSCPFSVPALPSQGSQSWAYTLIQGGTGGPAHAPPPAPIAGQLNRHQLVPEQLIQVPQSPGHEAKQHTPQDVSKAGYATMLQRVCRGACVHPGVLITLYVMETQEQLKYGKWQMLCKQEFQILKKPFSL